jgi:hypothetical protein
MVVVKTAAKRETRVGRPRHRVCTIPTTKRYYIPAAATSLAAYPEATSLARLVAKQKFTPPNLL